MVRSRRSQVDAVTVRPNQSFTSTKNVIITTDVGYEKLDNFEDSMLEMNKSDFCKILKIPTYYRSFEKLEKENL